MKKSYSSNHQSDVPILKSTNQIIFNVHLREIKWAILAMLLGVTSIVMIGLLSNDANPELPVIQLWTLLPVHIVATILIFWKPTIQFFSISFAIIMITNICLNIWGILFGSASNAHNVLLYSLPYLTLAACSIAIIPRVIAILMPLFVISILAAFAINAGHYSPLLNTLVLMSFIFNLVAVCFIAFAFHTTGKRIIGLSEKQRTQLSDFSFNEELVDLSLNESKQTILFLENNKVYQHPKNAEFINMIEKLNDVTDTTSSLLSRFKQCGYQVSNIDGFTATQTPNSRIVRSAEGKSYLFKQSTTSTDMQTALITDVSSLFHASTLLNTALSANKIGVNFYDSSGDLFMSKGVGLNTFSHEDQKSLKVLQDKIFGSRDHKSQATNVKIGSKTYDISFILYGETTLVTYNEIEVMKI